MGEPGANLPALRERTLPESEYRALKQRAEEAERLRARAGELEGALLAAELRAQRRLDAAEELMVAILPALDDFERALAAARARQDHGAIVEGVELTRRELLRVLALHGLERVPVAAGDPFDLSLHQTLEGADEALPAGAAVAGELRAGWRRGKKVLRRAIVRVEG